MYFLIAGRDEPPLSLRALMAATTIEEVGGWAGLAFGFLATLGFAGAAADMFAIQSRFRNCYDNLHSSYLYMLRKRGAKCKKCTQLNLAGEMNWIGDQSLSYKIMGQVGLVSHLT